MVQVKLVKHKDEIDELVDLFQKSFGHGMSAELWKWKYISSPMATNNPEIVVAIDNGNIIGARPTSVKKMWIGDKKVTTRQGSDLMVHPAYRGKGVRNKMEEVFSKYIQDKGYYFTYGFPNLAALRGNLKRGWRLISKKETLYLNRK